MEYEDTAIDFAAVHATHSQLSKDYYDGPMGEGKAELMQSVSQLANNTASLSSSAMLVKVNISKWEGRKHDKKASADIVASNGAKRGAANVHKRLLPNSDTLKAIVDHSSLMHRTHTRMTMPWADIGDRLLTTAQYMNYHNEMTALQNKFYALVDTFHDDYVLEHAEAQVHLGDMYDPSDYPSAEELRDKFRCTISYSPLPESGDFRVDLPKEAIADLQTSYVNYYEEKTKRAMDDMWHRLYKVLDNMSGRLDYQSKEDKKKFNDTLVSNVTDMIDLLRVSNVTNSPQMSAMADQLEEAFVGVTPDALREDDYFRAETKRAVDKAIASLPSLDI